MKKNNNLSNAIMTVLILMAGIANAQAQWNTTTGNSVTSTATYLGTNGSSTSPLQLKTIETGGSALPINFHTSNSTLPVMQIDANGDVGIGVVAPSERLQVVGGNIDVNDAAGSYMINGQEVLWHNDEPENIFVGIGAGANTTAAGVNNTFLGAAAGFGNTAGLENLFLGHIAGITNTTGDRITIVGSGGDVASSNLDYATAIGAFAFVSQSNSLVLGAVAGENFAPNNTNVGIGTTAPQNRLHINDVGTGAVYTQYTNSNTSATSTDGFHVGIASGGGAELRQRENTTMTFFTNNSERMRITNSGNVGINTTTPGARLQVENTSSAWGIYVSSNTAGLTEKTGIWSQGLNGTSRNIGVWGQATSTSPFISFPTAPMLSILTPVVRNAGVVGLAEAAPYNFGGIFEANSCDVNAHNYGIYASSKRAGGASCVPGTAGYFSGKVFATGAIIQNGSDVKLKDSINGITNALSVVSRLNPKYFVFKRDSFPYMNLPPGRHYGLIAQQVDTVLHELVHEITQPQITDTGGIVRQDTITFKAIDYTGLIPFAIRAIQELDSLKISSFTTKADSNRVVKWSTVDKTLVNGLIYDDGSKIGIPTTATNVYFNVANTGNSITAGKFEGGTKGLHGIATGTNATQHGILGESSGATTMNVGVKGEARRSTSGYNIGVQGLADSSSSVNVGVVASTIYTNSTSVNIGIYGDAKNSGFQNIAGQFLATDTIGLSYGVYASAVDTADYAGYFSGDVHVTGAFTRTSDAKLKNNIQNFSADTSLAWLGQLEPKTYQYRRADYPSLTLPAGTQYGFVAQDVEKVLPQLVKDVTHPEIRDLNGNLISHRMEYKSVDYLSFVPLLVGALQAQESKIETQQQKIDSLSEVITERLTAIENRLNGCCGTGAAFKNDESETTVNRINVELNSMQVIVLEQNVPNPFAEQTSVSYFVPENMETAQIVFADMLGNVIKTVDIKPGYGVMTVFASNLSTGQYSYTLLVDGKIAETKKMMKGK